MSDGLPDRDYDEEFGITLSWAEWNHVWLLVAEGIDKNKQDDEWPDEELERDRELQATLGMEIGEATPGNGISDWPDSMKKAYDETVLEMMLGE